VTQINGFGGLGQSVDPWCTLLCTTLHLHIIESGLLIRQLRRKGKEYRERSKEYYYSETKSALVSTLRRPWFSSLQETARCGKNGLQIGDSGIPNFVFKKTPTEQECCGSKVLTEAERELKWRHNLGLNILTSDII